MEESQIRPFAVQPVRLLKAAHISARQQRLPTRRIEKRQQLAGAQLSFKAAQNVVLWQ
jgi:hypothetical protein